MQAIISLRRKNSRSSLSRSSSRRSSPHRNFNDVTKSSLTRSVRLGNNVDANQPLQTLLPPQIKKPTENTKVNNKTTSSTNRRLNESILTNKKRKLIKLCFNYFKSTFSNLGLVLLVFLYSTFGALMFQLLEQHEEIKICEEGAARFQRELKHYRETIKLFILYNNTELPDPFSTTPPIATEPIIFKTTSNSNLNEITQTNRQRHQAESLEDLLVEFRKKIINIDKNYKYSGQNCTTDSKWNFFSALLFTVTVMSTVGYGYVAPITWEGRIVCICYASIGIPIFLLCLANLSSALGHLFKLIYAKLRLFLATCLSTKRKEQLLKNNAQTNSTDEIGSNFYSYQLNQLEAKLYESNIELTGSADNQDYFEHIDEIPMSVALTVIVVYILCGAYIFSNFESWSLIQSAYFVYATLSTIGFGDLVPGISVKDPSANLKLFTVCIYSLFGMAIIGMCINVMQDVAKRNVSKLVRHVKGFLSLRRKQEENLNLEDLDQEKEEMLIKIQTLKQLDSEISAMRKRKTKK